MIGRTLRPLSTLAVRGLVDVVVVANGCRDHTVSAAQQVPGIRVHSIQTASKPAALNYGDEVTTAWPRLYLDADIEIQPDAVLEVFAALQAGPILAARPTFRYRTEGASRLVRSYYRARSRIPSMSEHLWGAGAYALSEEAHTRLSRFPDLTADDLYVDNLFERSEICVVDTDPVLVHTPRTLAALVNVLCRVYRGKGEQKGMAFSSSSSGLAGIVQLVRGVRSWAAAVDAVVYIACAVFARMMMQYRSSRPWARDDTSRSLPVGTESSYA